VRFSTAIRWPFLELRQPARSDDDLAHALALVHRLDAVLEVVLDLVLVA